MFCHLISIKRKKMSDTLSASLIALLNSENLQNKTIFSLS